MYGKKYLKLRIQNNTDTYCSSGRMDGVTNEEMFQSKFPNEGHIKAKHCMCTWVYMKLHTHAQARTACTLRVLQHSVCYTLLYL